MRIPLPENGAAALQKGVESGTGLWQQLLGHGINLGGMHQKERQFDKRLAFDEKELAQRWQQHLQQIALQQLQEKRLAQTAALAAELHPLQMANTRAMSQYHQAQADELRNNQRLLNSWMNGGMVPQGGTPANMMGQPSLGPVPTGPEGFPKAAREVFPPSPQQIQQGFGGVNQLGIDPRTVAGGIFKKSLGFNPFEPSHEAKRAQEMEDFEKKEKFKAEQKLAADKNILTEPVRTQAQKTLIAAQSTLGLLDELIKEDVPGAIKGKFTVDQKAIADSLSNLTADDLMTIFNLPKDKHSTELVEQMTKKQFMESDSSFKKRLKQLKTRIEKKVNETKSILNTGNVNQHDTLPTVTNKDPLGFNNG